MGIIEGFNGKTPMRNRGFSMRILFMVLVAALTSFSCYKKTVKECKADYKEDIQKCDAKGESCEAAAEKQKGQCKAIANPTQKKKCIEDAKAAKDACEVDQKKCIKEAKEEKKSCKKSAKS